MKVLIVEDDKILSKTIEQCICNKYDTDRAFDGAEGLIYARQNREDLTCIHNEHKTTVSEPKYWLCF